MILNEWQRIVSKCEQPDQICQQRRRFKERLMKNGHHRIPKLCIKPKIAKHNNSNDQPIYLSIPYVNDMANTMIRRALTPLGLNIRIVHKGRPLQNILVKSIQFNPTRSGKCELKKCPVNSNLCFKKMVVYQATCTTCSLSYIGSTKKHFHDRMKEHHSMKESSIFQHNTYHNTWTYNILSHGHNRQDLRFREAQLIKDLQPKLNKKDEFALSKISLVL